MGTAVGSLISIAVMLVIAFSALGSMFSAKGAESEARLTHLDELEMLLRSDVTATGAATSTTVSGHSDADLMLTNRGALSYAVYSEWDVIIHYVRANGIQDTVSLPYATTLADNTWTMQAIYLDADTSTTELLEPGAFNPEEEALIRARVAPWAKTGTPAWAVVTPPEGPPISISFTNPMLHVLDRDDELVYLYDGYGTLLDTMALDSQNTDSRGITV